MASCREDVVHMQFYMLITMAVCLLSSYLNCPCCLRHLPCIHILYVHMLTSVYLVYRKSICVCISIIGTCSSSCTRSGRSSSPSSPSPSPKSTPTLSDQASLKWNQSCLELRSTSTWKSEPSLLAHSMAQDPSDWVVLDHYATMLYNKKNNDNRVLQAVHALLFLVPGPDTSAKVNVNIFIKNKC